ncbi:hypothetical protein D3C81_199060 [compost metagenome]
MLDENVVNEQREFAKKIFDIIDNDVLMSELAGLGKYRIDPKAEFNETRRSFNIDYGLPYSFWFAVVFYKDPVDYKFMLVVQDYVLNSEFTSRKEFIMFSDSYDKLLTAVKVLLSICWEHKL